ncbi:hypothetical protein NKI15_19865 [Mesorhizobium sp. M0862]|uniref:hypothetical protein n=1 Tax=Mesorhizobium sp. M0862 TaxID=2957015 RepID=UPI00333DC726
MPKKFTHTQAFAHFETVPANVQWSWSARNEGKKIVVVTLWQDEFKKVDGKLVYARGALWNDAKRRNGHNELMKNLRWALDNCEGWLKVIIAIPKDKNARPRSISECFPSQMRVRVVQLDEATGEFALEAVS